MGIISRFNFEHCTSIKYQCGTYIRRVFVQGENVAVHGFLLPVVDVRVHSLLVHGEQLMFFGRTFFFQRLHRLLEPERHPLLELLGHVRVLGTHLLVPFLQIGPVFHHFGHLLAVQLLQPVQRLLVQLVLVPGIEMREVRVRGGQIPDRTGRRGAGSLGGGAGGGGGGGGGGRRRGRGGRGGGRFPRGRGHCRGGRWIRRGRRAGRWYVVVLVVIVVLLVVARVVVLVVVVIVIVVDVFFYVKLI